MTTSTIPPGTVTLANANNAAPQITHTLLFTVTGACSLADIGFYSPAGAAALPDSCCLFDTSGQAQVSGTVNLSPSWSGAAASGWVECPYASGPALTAGHTYVAAVHLSPSAVDGYGKTTAFWSSGTGASGFTAGPVTAPNVSTNSLQGAVASGQSTLTYPNVTEAGSYFGVGVTVVSASGTPSGLLMTAIV